MNARWITLGTVAMLGVALVATEASAQTRISYGRITAVRQVNIEDQGAQAAGTIVGGALGAMSGSGRSRSNRALRGVAGAAVGSSVAGAASRATGFEYTVLVGNQTIRMVTEQAGLRVGDCVSVEQGAFNNIRLADDSRCAAAAGGPSAADQQEANACATAKQQLLDAVSDEDFDRAERRMRLLCGD